MKEIVIGIIKNHLALKQKVTINSKISSLSIDSFSFIEILLDIEECYQIRFTDEDIDIKKYSYVFDILRKIEELKCIKK